MLGQNFIVEYWIARRDDSLFSKAYATSCMHTHLSSCLESRVVFCEECGSRSIGGLQCNNKEELFLSTIVVAHMGRMTSSAADCQFRD